MLCNGSVLGMPSVFALHPSELGELGPEKAVDLFRELLWAEATSIGLGKNLINVPSRITVADGGIDAEVDAPEEPGGQGIIKGGATRYQIKSGSFDLTDTEIKRILFKQDRTALKPRIQSCLGNHGTLVIVFFGWDDPDRQDSQCAEAFKDVLVAHSPEYASAKIEIWRQNTIAGFLNNFPSLVSALKGLSDSNFVSHSVWASEAEMRAPFVTGEQQKTFIDSIRQALRNNTDAIHIRVNGEPGIGKTRLVLEATSEDDLAPLVIYYSNASFFRDSNLMNDLRKEDNTSQVILVVDECSSDSSSYIWDKFKYLGPRIRLVTINHDFESRTGGIQYPEVPTLDDKQISAIIQQYSVPDNEANRWAEFCGGSPRVAHVFGLNLKNNPDDLLKPPDTKDVWERYIRAGDDPASEGVQIRRTVLQHVALFKRFGFGSAVITEAKAIAALAAVADSHVTWPRFQSVIYELRQRRILQGEATLYITPRALHIKLWTDWWQVYGEGFDFQSFLKDIPASLHDWFFEMFQYAHESGVATRLIEEILDGTGPIPEQALLETRVGSRLFLSLARAAPEASLKFLKRTIGTKTKDQLLDFKVGRRDVLWALEGIAVWRPLFSDAARLVLQLAEAENETWANNATGVFVGLFSTGEGQVAPSEAPPQERFLLLEEGIASESKVRRVLAIKACDNALETQLRSRLIGSEFQGIRVPPQLWRAKTYGERFDALRMPWKLLVSSLDHVPQDEQKDVVEILLRRAGPLSATWNLSEMVVETVESLLIKPYVDKTQVLERVIKLLGYFSKHLPPEIQPRWCTIRDQLTGNDFASLLKRYVALDLFEDKYDEKARKPSDKLSKEISALAEQAVADQKLLVPELSWLITNQAKNSYQFGYEVSTRDMELTCLPLIYAAQKTADTDSSLAFLGGYFRGIYERDLHRWEQELDNLAGDQIACQMVPELTWRSGLTDKAGRRVLELAEKGLVGFEAFAGFRYGTTSEALSTEVFESWITFLLGVSDPACDAILLDLYYGYYVWRESKARLPEELTFRLLTERLPATSRVRQGSMDDYHWGEIAVKVVRSYPEHGLALADAMLSNFAGLGYLAHYPDHPALRALANVAEQKPKETWEIVASYLGPPIDERAFNIYHWLRDGGLELFPQDAVFAWVDQDVDGRAWYLANFVPKKPFQTNGELGMGRLLLVRYGASEDVRRNLRGNFMSESYWGPASIHYTEIQNRLVQTKKDETDRNVVLWLDEFIQILEREIRREKIEEERRYQ